MAGDLIQVVLINPDEADRREVEQALLHSGMAIPLRLVASFPSVPPSVDEHACDFILLSCRGRPHELDPLPELKEHAPVMVIVPAGQEAFAVEALDRGAFDCLVCSEKQYFAKRLAVRLRQAMEAKRVMTAMRTSEALYQDLYDSAPDMYLLLSRSGDILSVNRNGAAQLGYEAKELIGQSVTMLIHELDRSRVLRALERTFTELGSIHHLEFRNRPATGEVWYLSVRMQAQGAVEGGGEELRMICRNVTAEREAERREEVLKDRLARTQRLQSLAILAGGVAHDLNNILMPLVAYPDLLLEGLKLNETSQECRDIREIKKSALSAADIVRDLLTMARRGRFEKRTVRINDVVTQFKDSATGRDIKKRHPGVRASFALAKKVSTIAGSATHISKILMNLMINAAEAMPGGGRLMVSTEDRRLKKPIHGYETIPEGEYVVLTVTDTGVGIPLKDRERIFEPFYSRKRLGRSGTGLGLPVVYGVIKDHDGFVDVQPGPKNVGTSFIVYFPHGEVAEVAGEEGGDCELTHSGSVLVVDDLPDQRMIACRLLSRLGYKVQTVSSGMEAKKLAEKITSGNGAGSPFDVVVIDMILEEEFDGLDTYRSLIKLVPDQKCIMVSGYAETERVREALEEGALAFIRKPYTLDELKRVVRKVMKPAQSTQ